MDSDEDDRDFADGNGEALEIGDGDDSENGDYDEEDDDDAPQQQPQRAQPPMNQGSGKKTSPPGKGPEVKGEQVENQPYDLAVEVNDSEEIDSGEDEEEDEVHIMGQQQQQQTTAMNQKGPPMQIQPTQKKEDVDSDDEKEVLGAYNPQEFANLKVSSEVKDLFEYIGRYKPQKIDLESKIKPFVPEYIPCIGEVDAHMKMPKPDGTKEDLGISVLDEPILNPEDTNILKMKYIQAKNLTGTKDKLDVESIEHADKKSKEINRWISNIAELHKNRPLPSVNYTKQMPDFDDLMTEWPQEMEHVLKDTPFPGPEIDMHPLDYSKLVLTMLDIPTHKLANNKSTIESLHVLFTLYSVFKENTGLQQNQGDHFVNGDANGGFQQF